MATKCMHQMPAPIAKAPPKSHESGLARLGAVLAHLAGEVDGAVGGEGGDEIGERDQRRVVGRGELGARAAAR